MNLPFFLGDQSTKGSIKCYWFEEENMLIKILIGKTWGEGGNKENKSKL